MIKKGLGLGIFFSLLILFSLKMGTVSIPWHEFLFWKHQASSQTMFQTILWEVRLPRICIGLLVGASLSISGTLMQGVFRNPLADPYLLGIAGGASAGACFSFLWFASPSPMLLTLFSFLGSSLSLLLLFSLSTLKWFLFSSHSLLLAGIAIGSIGTAFSSLFLALSSKDQTQQMLFWMMGSLTSIQWISVAILFVVFSLCFGFMLFAGKTLNAMILGDKMAYSLGVHPLKSRLFFLGVASLLTSVSIAFCGTIGFVGLIIPHVARIFVGNDFRKLIPCSAFAGACFLLLCDDVARILFSPSELPIGVVTALFGAPFFLYLLLTQTKERKS